MSKTFLDYLIAERDLIVSKRNKHSSSKEHYDYYSRQLYSVNNIIINKINENPTK